MTQEDTQKIADFINLVKMGFSVTFPDFDAGVQLINDAAEAMASQASMCDSAAVLNPMWSGERGDVLKAQAKGIKHLAEFVASLKECQRLKEIANTREGGMREMAKLFGGL